MLERTLMLAIAPLRPAGGEGKKEGIQTVWEPGLSTKPEGRAEGPRKERRPFALCIYTNVNLQAGQGYVMGDSFSLGSLQKSQLFLLEAT